MLFVVVLNLCFHCFFIFLEVDHFYFHLTFFVLNLCFFEVFLVLPCVLVCVVKLICTMLPTKFLFMGVIIKAMFFK